MRTCLGPSDVLELRLRTSFVFPYTVHHVNASNPIVSYLEAL